MLPQPLFYRPAPLCLVPTTVTLTGAGTGLGNWINGSTSQWFRTWLAVASGHHRGRLSKRNAGSLQLRSAGDLSSAWTWKMLRWHRGGELQTGSPWLPCSGLVNPATSAAGSLTKTSTYLVAVSKATLWLWDGGGWRIMVLYVRWATLKPPYLILSKNIGPLMVLTACDFQNWSLDSLLTFI